MERRIDFVIRGDEEEEEHGFELDTPLLRLLLFWNVLVFYLCVSSIRMKNREKERIESMRKRRR